MLKKNGGITLIALVITIIVLLILAGVSIAMLTGENGLLNRTTDAADKEKIAGAKDVVTTDVAAYGADWYEAKYVNPTPTTQTIDAFIADKFTKTSAEGCTITAGTKTVGSGTEAKTYTTYTVNVTGAAAGKPAAVGTLKDGAITWEWSTVPAQS